MRKNGTTFSKLSKDKRISKEYKRLLKIFEDIDEDKKELMDGLIYQAAFMRVQLDDYQIDINENGYVESFQQSDKISPYERLRPVAQLYNTTNKNYQSIIKQLVDALPDVSNKEQDELMEFLKK